VKDPGGVTMKILQINAVNGILSTGRTTLDLAEELKLLGHDTYIAYAMAQPYGDHSYRIGCCFDRKLHALGSRIFGLQAYFSVIATLRLIRYIKRLSPDIVQLHNLHSNYINLKLLLHFLAKEKIATVVTLHDCWFFTGRCFHYTEINCYQWQTKCLRCPKNTFTTPSWFFDRSEKMWRDKMNYFSKLDHLAVVGVSDWITKEAEKSFLSKADRIIRIYNWINLEVFKPIADQELRQSLGLRKKFILLGVAAFWDTSKGILEFIELSKMLSRDDQLILIGAMDTKYDLPSNIISIPQTNDCMELVRYYSMSDVLISLSKEESFGKVVIEAMACGTPAVVYNTTALPELIGYGCGYVTDRNTIQEVYQRIEQIKANTKAYYSENCRRFTEEHFDLHQGVKAYEALYQSLI
jgi:glycosyltransferase involved in cell wall biosynthesis